MSWLWCGTYDCPDVICCESNWLILDYRVHLRGAVLLGNYVEERAKKELPSRTPVFSSVSEAHEQFGAKVSFHS